MGLKRLDPEDFLVSAERVTQTVWTGNLPTLTTFHTSSTQKSSVSGDYYLSVYDKTTSDDTAEKQFDISYGNEDGGGGLLYNPSVISKSPTQSVYGQLRNLIYQTETGAFNFDGYTSKSIFAISIERSRYRERLLPGTFSIVINGLTLTDNSGDNPLPNYIGTQRVFQIVAQSSDLGSGYGDGNGRKSGYTSDKGSFGFFLPDVGLLVFNGDALAKSTGRSTGGGAGLTVTTTSNNDAQNPINLYSAITSFTLNGEETITSDFIFARARNSEFNYSENPSFTQGTTGEVYHSTSINNPQVYIAAVGLYNDANELVAVAKVSRPLLKDFTKEALLRVKLDF